MKKNIGVIVAVVIVLVLAFVWWNSKNSETNIASNQETQNTVQESNTTVPPIETKKAGFTMADVAAHNLATDCYTIVGDKVYGLTDWISKHPGGEKAILGLCGVDGTEAFTKQHGSFQKAKDALAGYLVGDLIQ